jgi:hypothetical protein
MKIKDFLNESNDSRTIRQKIIDLIDHPNTPDSIKAVARQKLNDLYPINNIIINVKETDLDAPFYRGTTYRDILISLSSLPKVSQIRFGHSTIAILITPPFDNPVTKDSIINTIVAALPWIKKGKIEYTLRGTYEIYCYF